MIAGRTARPVSRVLSPSTNIPERWSCVLLTAYTIQKALPSQDTTDSSILRRPRHFLWYRLSGRPGFGHRCLPEVALRERVTGRSFCAFLNQLGKESPHLPQLILYGEFLFFSLLRDPHDRMQPGVRGAEDGWFALTTIADKLVSCCAGQ